VARKLVLVAATVGLSCALAASALAQGTTWKAAGTGPQIGPVAGVNIFTFGGANTSGVKSRTAFYAGLALDVPLGGTLFVQPEVLYAQKGAKETDPTLGTLTLKLAYVEVPILLGFNFGSPSSVRPRIYAGPSVGINLSCDFEETLSGVSQSASCSSLSTSIKSLDLGVTGGGGVAIPFGRAMFTLDARYTLGLTKITDGGTAKNQGFSVGAGIMFRFGGK
jgi:hypothetical protein